MNNLLLRAITGAIFVGLIVGVLWYNKIYPTLIVMSLFFILAVIEFFGLFKDKKSIDISSTAAIIIIVILYSLIISSVSGIISWPFLYLSIPLVFLLFLTELWRKKENPISNIGIYAFSIFYLIIPFIMIIHLYLLSDHIEPLAIGMFLLIWTNDTFAYLTGRFVGKTKLFERISPKKTWEGTIGGILFTITAAYFIGQYCQLYGSLFWMIAACIVAPCAIFGDLLESLFKRSLNIKDSGTILPGHGGILDRFDATLFTVPFFYCWTMFYSYF